VLRATNNIFAGRREFETPVLDNNEMLLI